MLLSCWGGRIFFYSTTVLFFLLTSNSTTTTTTTHSPPLVVSSPWCPPSQRYDVHQFPPRCLECPGGKISVNPMRLSSIGTRLRSRQHAVKFSPGLPHNQTCGCWRAGNQSVMIDVSLNASRVVSGLAFHTTTTTANRNRWLRRFSVAAGDPPPNNNNSSSSPLLLDWGTYTQSNASAAAAVFFRYPIRASLFRITVLEYVNHMINASDGFPLRINALVSDSEPFGCDCAALATGECCPLANMEVKNNTCVMCMDPTDIHTVVVDGCGRCKPGTRQLGSTLRCVPVVVPAATNTLEVSAVRGDDEEEGWWRFQVNFSSSALAIVYMMMGGGDHDGLCDAPFITDSNECFFSLLQRKDFVPLVWDLNISDYFHKEDEDGSRNSTRTPAIAQITRQINPQYIQFDRGRGVLELAIMTNESLIQATTTTTGCGEAGAGNRCTGVIFIGALFISPSNKHFLVDMIMQRRLIFQLDQQPPSLRSLVCSFPARQPIPPAATIEIHHLVDTNQYRLVFASFGHTFSNGSTVQWDDTPDRVAVGTDGILERQPPAEWFSMRVFTTVDHHQQQFLVRGPVPIVRKNALLSLQFARASTWIKIAYGLGLKPTREPSGDSEQLTTISAVSKQPIRLTRLVSFVRGIATVYTSPKGFISDPRRALDLVVACNGMMSVESMVAWLESGLELMDTQLRSFVERSCGWVRRGEVSKLYWLIPALPVSTGRRERVDDVRVEVDFV